MPCEPGTCHASPGHAMRARDMPCEPGTCHASRDMPCELGTCKPGTCGPVSASFHKEYLEAVKQTPHMSLEDLLTFTQQFGDVYFHPNIYHCATLAVGAALQLVDNIMAGKVRNGMALVRPPGHHSQRSEANGFCVFNNVAIAALYAKKHYNLNRVLIVDWDVHHGQGVQYCFEEDSSVLYFSWHRYEHQRFWPNLADSEYDRVGKGKGSGFNINLPWNKVGMTNSDYLAAFFHVLLPIAYEFDPELVFVCAGFDSAIGDPEGHMCASPEIFGHLTHLLMSLAEGRLCVVLEGGYNLTSLAQSVCQTVQTLLGDPTPALNDVGPPCLSALESIHNVRAAHQGYWGYLKHIVSSVSEPSTKRCRVEEKENEQKEETVEHLVWAEPAPRDAPPVHTAALISKGLEDSLPEACHLLGQISPKYTEDAEKIRKKHFQDLTDETSLQCIQDVVSLLEKIKNKEVWNGLITVPDVFLSLKCAVEHAKNSLAERILVLFVGDGDVPVDTTDGTVLLVQICRKEPEGVKSLYHVPVCLNKDVFSSASVMAAVLGLLLPLAYEFNPGLVLQVVAGGSGGLEVCVWAQLTSLLRGVAQGKTLALLKGCDRDMVRATGASLSGASAPSLRSLDPPLPEDVEVIEAQRQRLQQRWGLLVNTETCTADKERVICKVYNSVWAQFQEVGQRVRTDENFYCCCL
ncbi:polyamine deacetylase HDAC10 isoform X2 [Tachysurus fulvidraco]|uniref:polyamine deacetylase HDAC10 isoform X2 n=1 Tax=Tachysurus fulvidraco TaxID=1234273 RepID=UPI001FEFB177|nr:polyamine deacetylase HDAC10 isoform X2 [Tachysurus fulvidraco]